MTPALTKTLSEFVAVVHFHVPLNLNILDLASWAAAFPEYTKVQQVPAGARVDITAAPQIQFSMSSASDLPRLMLTDESGLTVQLQTDRFAYGWTRQDGLGRPAQYPGFEAMTQGLDATFQRFSEWHKSRLGIPPVPIRLVELAYVNLIPIEKDGHRRRLSDVFKFVTPGTRKVNGFTTLWIESLGADPDSPRVTAQVGLAKAPPDLDVIGFNFVGLAKIGPDADIRPMLNALHDRITDMYQTSMNPET